MINVVQNVPEDVRIQRVLISVADKTGVWDFVQGLIRLNPQILIYSTGGTHALLSQKLREWNEGTYADRLVSVSEYTGQKEMQGGLVKTLDFRIYLGLLSEPYNNEHANDMAESQAEYLDMVVVNLYPFEKKIQESGITLEGARSHIDIGGPTMLRASAKNFIRVASVCKPELYDQLLTEMETRNGSLSLETRLLLAKTTFAHTAAYDRAIDAYLAHLPAEALQNSYEIVQGVWK